VLGVRDVRDEIEQMALGPTRERLQRMDDA
jgi:hypothetical protein